MTRRVCGSELVIASVSERAAIKSRCHPNRVAGSGRLAALGKRSSRNGRSAPTRFRAADNAVIVGSSIPVLAKDDRDDP